ncbi:MAG: Crp/Fnr family transcriptional regulator [Desulfobacterales bacterium]|nr:Crp/Fnr family transcriptional regulator [Desulfobacterales bacterium]
MNSNSAGNESGPSSEYQENLDMLRQIPFFTQLPLEPLKVFAYLCQRETFKKGDYIYAQDEDDGRAVYIISGEAMILRKSQGAETPIRACGKGDFLGRFSLMGPMPRLFSLQAMDDMTCLILSREKFTRALEQFPGLVPRVLRALVERVLSWEKRFFVDHPEIFDSCKESVGISLY